MQRRFGELGSSSAVVACICRRCRNPACLAVADNTRHGRLTRGFLAVTQYLREKRPDHDRRGVDAMQTEQAAMLSKDSLDAFRRENFGERQSLASECLSGNWIAAEKVGVFLRKAPRRLNPFSGFAR